MDSEVGSPMGGDVGLTDCVGLERRIDELDGMVREIRSGEYRPGNVNRIAELIRERDELIRRLFELHGEGTNSETVREG